MFKKVCSVLLSSVLAFGVSTKKSDAGFLSGALKYIGACGFMLTASLANLTVLDSKIRHTHQYGWDSFRSMNRQMVRFYGFFATLYAIGKLDEICNTIVYSSNSNINDKNVAKSRSQSNGEFSLLSKYKEKTEDKK